jgi:hypothetical protein
MHRMSKCITFMIPHLYAFYFCWNAFVSNYLLILTFVHNIWPFALFKKLCTHYLFCLWLTSSLKVF